MKISINKNALLSALEGAKNLYPSEFIGLFRGGQKKDAIELTELIITPFASYEEDSSAYSPYFIPANTGALASFHSHPTPDSAFPSKQDKRFFSQMPVHFIACHPFNIDDVNAFDAKARRIEFNIA